MIMKNYYHQQNPHKLILNNNNIMTIYRIYKYQFYLLQKWKFNKNNKNKIKTTTSFKKK